MILEVHSSDNDEGIIKVGSTKMHYMFIEEAHPDLISYNANEYDIEESEDEMDLPNVERKLTQSIALNQSNATKTLFLENNTIAQAQSLKFGLMPLSFGVKQHSD